jgi:hypothetical protein
LGPTRDEKEEGKEEKGTRKTKTKTRTRTRTQTSKRLEMIKRQKQIKMKHS